MRKVFAIGQVVVLEMLRRKDFYVLFILTALLTVALGSMSFIGQSSMARYMKELCLSLIWISILVMAVTTSARQIPAEREQRKIMPLLAKPVSRWQMILGKFLGCWMVCGGALLVFYLFFGVVVLSREKSMDWVLVIQAGILHWTLAAVLVSMALMGSLILSTPAANSTLCILLAGGLLFMGRHLNQVAMGLVEPIRTLLQLAYYTLPHLEFYDLRDMLVHNHPPVRALSVLWAIVYGFCYTTLFLVVTWGLFRKKPINS